MEHECRCCHRILPATDEHFYRAGKHFNWICKPCCVANNMERKRRRHGRPGFREVTCLHCGEVFRSARVDVSLCSYECRYRWRNEREKQARLEAKPERKCLHCGAEMPPEMRVEACYCTARCNQHAHQLVRKFAGRAGTQRRKFHRAQLGERDDWRCQLCGDTVEREREYPDPLAPSVDHRLPLALGGTNDLANLQLAHLRCNLRKRHCVGDMQLRLVG